MTSKGLSNRRASGRRATFMHDVKCRVTFRSLGETDVLIPALQETPEGAKLLELTLRSLHKFAPSSVSVWVIERGGPRRSFQIGPRDFPRVNFIRYSGGRNGWGGIGSPRRAFRFLGFPAPRSGSWENGLGLEVGLRELRRCGKTKGSVFTMHQDALPTDSSFFQTLLDLLDQTVAVVGVREQSAHGSPARVVHPLGALWRYSTLDSLSVGLLPRMPAFDVGEHAVAIAQQQGWKIQSLFNSFSDPDIEEKLGLKPWDGPQWDRVYGQKGNLCFLHLGRGIQKSTGGGTPTGLQEWVNFVEGVLEA